MPLKFGKPYDPQKVLNSRTTKKFVADHLDTDGIVEVGAMSGGLPSDDTIKLGLLVKENQTVQKFKFRATNYNVLSGADPAVQADLNATLLRPWEKGTLKWLGFRLLTRQIPSQISHDKLNVDLEFSLKPFVAGDAQDMVIVFQKGNEPSFGNSHFNFGVSTLKPSAARTAPAKGAKSKGASKGGGRPPRR